MGLGPGRLEALRGDSEKADEVLAAGEAVEPFRGIPAEEFVPPQERVACVFGRAVKTPNQPPAEVQNLVGARA